MLSVETRGKVLVMKLVGELEEEHLEEANLLVTEKIEDLAEVRILMDLRQYVGARDLHGAWQGFKLVTSHKDKVGKIAVVGSLDWQKLATLIMSPFTRAVERFFEPDEIDEALKWLRG